MSKSSVIKSLMALKGISRPELAEKIGTTLYSLRSKFSRDYFSTDDVIRIATALDVRLAFVDKEGRILVSFQPEDAKTKGEEK